MVNAANYCLMTLCFVSLQDTSSLGFSNAKVHPIATENGSTSTSGKRKVWAKKRKKNGCSLSSIDSSHKSVVSSEPMTCDSVGSTEAAVNLTTMSESNENHSHGSDGHMSASATTPGSDQPKLPDDRDGKDVNIDFSHINDVVSANSKVSSPSKDYMMFTMSAPVKRLEHPADKSLMLSFLGSLFFLIAALVVFCPIVAIIVLLFPVGWLLKHCMACCCCCAPNRTCACCCSKMVSHSDAIWLHDFTLNQMIMQSLITLEKGINISQIRELINTRLICAEGKHGKKLYPRFSQKVVPVYSGYAWSNDTDFCIDNHIYAMPNTVHTKADLEQYLSEMSTKTLVMDRPLWEMLILSEFGEDKDTVVLFRVHPCVTDGISLVQILIKSIVDSQCLAQIKPRFGQGAFIFNAVRAFMIGPIVFLHKWIFMRRDYNLLHGPGLSGQKVVAWSEPFCLSTAIRVKQVTRSTLNDILLSVAAGNIRTYFQSRGVNNPYDILATIPVDLRSDGPNIKMGTKFSFIDITLPTNIEGTIPRLWEVKHEMDEVKNSANPVVMSGSQWLLTNMFPEYIYKRIWWSIWNKATCAVSNLPGPDTVLTFASREVKSMVAWLPTAPDVALSICFMTYADEVRMAVIGDKAIVPNPHVLTNDFIFQVRSLIYAVKVYMIPPSLNLPPPNKNVLFFVM